MRRNKARQIAYVIGLEAKVMQLEQEKRELRAALDETTGLIADKMLPALLQSSQIVSQYVEELKRRHDG